MSKMKISYPAIFKNDEEDPNFINVCFPDIFGAYTFGDGIDDAIYMAKDLLKLMLETAPAQCEKPQTLEYTKKNFPDYVVSMIEVEIDS